MENNTNKPREHFAETPYGFEWGSAKITRAFSDPRQGWVTICIDTPKVGLQVYVTKTGKVRVHDKDGELLKRQSK